jgi:iron complex transport system substrate-binding protein
MSLFVLILLIHPTRRLWSEELSITFSDFSGQKITLAETPQRVVSLVPSITEILMRIGAGDSVVGITTHDVRPVEVAQKALVGGFLNPDMNRVATLQPDVIFYADLYQNALSHLSFKAKTICLAPGTLAEGFADIRSFFPATGLGAQSWARSGRTAEDLRKGFGSQPGHHRHALYRRGYG